MTAKLYLTVVEDADMTKDSILNFTSLPGMKGEDDESLACGRCKTVLCRNVSTRTVYSKFGAPNRLLIRCTCGATNLLPSQRGVPEGYQREK